MWFYCPPFFQGRRMALRFTQEVNVGGGLQGCSPPHTVVCASLSSLYKYLQSLPQGLQFSAARPGPLNSCNVSPTPVTEPFCSQARPSFFTLRVGRGTQKGEPHTSVQRGKLRHRAGPSEGQGPGVVSRSSKKPRAAGKAAGGETLFCFLKLPAGTKNTKSSL